MIARTLNLHNSLHQVDVHSLLGVPQNLAVSGNSPRDQTHFLPLNNAM
jgi:hypothetical protein